MLVEMDAPNPPPVDRLRMPLARIPWIGEAGASLLARLELFRVRDLIFYFPKQHEPAAALVSLAEVQENLPVRLIGELLEVDQRGLRDGRSLTGALFQAEDGGRFRALWFNMPFMRQQLLRGERYLIQGKPKLHGGRWQWSHPRLTRLEPGQDGQSEVGLLPIYGLTEGITQARLRGWVRRLLAATSDSLQEVFPEPYRAARNLLGIQEAVQTYHFPADEAQASQARERLVYQELLVLQAALALRRATIRQAPAIPLPRDSKLDSRIRRRIPFILSGEQDQVIDELAADLAQAIPMQRLLQGDVGTGKTMVAVYCLLLAAAHGCQATLMVPTEVLARQQFQTLERVLKESKVKLGLLLGKQPASEREQLLASIAKGETQVVVGTQALIQEGVKFHKLALAVIDEQHRFGVLERAALKQGEFAPHYLVMTATPIPRTLMLTACGDLDLSTLKNRPVKGQVVETHLVTQEQEAAWWEFVRKKIRAGRQGFVVAPLVDQSEHIAASSAEELYERLSQTELAGFKVGLVHGRLASGVTQATMDAFRLGKLDALVCTSVIEVGLDVPNASTITIYNPERFGLAQLHQLRGRVGRGLYPGYCACLLGAEPEHNAERLAAFAKSQSGFELAELDFQLRGPGEVLGTRQSGLPRLTIADLQRDGEIMQTARADARALVEAKALDLPEWQALAELVKKRHGQGMQLGDVG